MPPVNSVLLGNTDFSLSKDDGEKLLHAEGVGRDCISVAFPAQHYLALIFYSRTLLRHAEARQRPDAQEYPTVDVLLLDKPNFLKA